MSWLRLESAQQTQCGAPELGATRACRRHATATQRCHPDVARAVSGSDAESSLEGRGGARFRIGEPRVRAAAGSKQHKRGPGGYYYYYYYYYYHYHYYYYYLPGRHLSFRSRRAKRSPRILLCAPHGLVEPTRLTALRTQDASSRARAHADFIKFRDVRRFASGPEMSLHRLLKRRRAWFPRLPLQRAARVAPGFQAEEARADAGPGNRAPSPQPAPTSPSAEPGVGLVGRECGGGGQSESAEEAPLPDSDDAASSIAAKALYQVYLMAAVRAGGVLGQDIRVVGEAFQDTSAGSTWFSW